MNDDFSGEFKRRFHYKTVQKFINKDFPRFKKEIQSISQEGLENVFFHALNNIDTVWMNKACGFYEMKYICECMIQGCRINDISNMNEWSIQSQHFKGHFYHDLVNAIGSLNENNREQIQKNIDTCRKLKSLHSDFKQFYKYEYNST